jgi:hypothetical protein
MARGPHGRAARIKEQDQTSRATVPYNRNTRFSYPASINRPPIIIRLDNQEFSGEDEGSMAEHRVGQQLGRLASPATGKKAIKRRYIPQPQSGDENTNLLNTQPRRGLTIHAEWIETQTIRGNGAANRNRFVSPVRSVHREKAGETAISSGALKPHPDRDSLDDNDESVGDNEADESDQSSFERLFAAIVRQVIRWMGPGS